MAWLKLEECDSQLQDLTEEGLALCHEDCPKELLGSAHVLLAELVGDVDADVVLEDDASWDRFPEVGEAFLLAGGPKVSYNIAICDVQGVWAVGVAGKWKQRIPVAKLALCVALVLQSGGEGVPKIWGRYAGLAGLCRAAEAARGGAAHGTHARTTRQRTEVGALPLRRKREVQEPSDEELKEYEPEEPPDEECEPDEPPEENPEECEPDEPPEEDPEVFEECDAEEAPDEEASVGHGTTQAKSTLPRDKPLRIRLPEEDDVLPPELEGMPEEALALSTEGKNRKGLYAKADAVIAQLASDCATDVQYHDDFDWKLFPMVGAALKELAEAEECICVAVCSALGLWAVGVGMRGQNRLRAAKLAIAAAIALRMEEEEENDEKAELPEDFAAFVEEARVALADAE